MAQVFSSRANAYLKMAGILVPAALVILVATYWKLNLSPWESEAERFVEQPVPFSHEHHVSGLGIDCRYCHTSVEESSSAGMPPTHTCMSCHSQLWTESEMLRPVRTSYREDRPLKWKRVYRLPDYVYFNHSAHVTSGVGCESCHGRVDQMPLMQKQQALRMQWCLECHRAPEEHLRPEEYIYAFGYDLPDDEQRTLGRRLIEHYDIDVSRMTNCSICHR